MIGVGIVGTGPWGLNHVRVIDLDANAEVRVICDIDEVALGQAGNLVPAARKTPSFESLLKDPTVDAVVVATPSICHASMASQAIDAGKHVLVEKPIAFSAAEVARIKRQAEEKEVVVMVGHLMLFHPALLKLRDLVASGELGTVHYIYSSRLNLGRLRRDENVLWSFAPHDFSMIYYLLGETPATMICRGQSYLQPGIEDVVFVNMLFDRGVMANVHLSWLDPNKTRRITIVGSKKMAVFDDVAAEKLRVYDKGFDVGVHAGAFSSYEEFLIRRQGDIHIPHLHMREPLVLECEHFLNCIRDGEKPRANLDFAHTITSMIEAAGDSLRNGGQETHIDRRAKRRDDDRRIA